MNQNLRTSLLLTNPDKLKFNPKVIHEDDNCVIFGMNKHMGRLTINKNKVLKERLLTYSERYKLWFANNYETGMEYNEDIVPDFDDDYYKHTPTKLITITYNDKTIESYE
jgi:phage terminase large subunit